MFTIERSPATPGTLAHVDKATTSKHTAENVKGAQYAFRCLADLPEAISSCGYSRAWQLKDS